MCIVDGTFKSVGFFCFAIKWSNQVPELMSSVNRLNLLLGVH